MSRKPPDDLMQWRKGDLAKEVARLRAVLHEHSQRVGSDPRSASTDAPITGGTPHGQGDALIDARAAVLLDHTDVALVDTKGEALVCMLVLGGRVNYSDDVVQHAYLTGPDGAAGIVAELISLATRAAHGAREEGQAFAWAFRQDLERRMSEQS